MRTGDMLLTFTHGSARDRRDFNLRVKRASGVIGSVLAVGTVAMALAGAFPARQGQEMPSTAQASVVNAGEERGGTLLELETLW
jgi:hypothetical protein